MSSSFDKKELDELKGYLKYLRGWQDGQNTPVVAQLHLGVFRRLLIEATVLHEISPILTLLAERIENEDPGYGMDDEARENILSVLRWGKEKSRPEGKED